MTWTNDWLLLAPAVVMTLLYRRRAAKWEAKANAWLSRCNLAEAKVEHYERLAEEEAASDERIFQNVMAEVNRQSAWPDDLLIGTLANPLIIDRTYIDSSLSDRAWAGTVDEFAPTVLPE